jgi:nitroimidazol reductase NimA-like FMN-containing flavoprotein (pyridoxamine 5'-phosphate oxidase superfamily)
VIPRSELRLTEAELNAYLDERRTLRLATVGDDAVPHVVPLWFLWYDGVVWLNSLRRSVRHEHLRSGRPVGLVVDDGATYAELRGVRMTGVPDVVGQDEPVRDEALRRFAAKYFGGATPPSQRAYEVVRITPTEIASWDFRKIPAGADRKVGLDRS